MALRTFVKVSAVNNLTDARYCAGMYVNLLGFSLEKDGKNFVSPEKHKEITDWLSGLEYVAEFDKADGDTISDALASYEGFSFIESERLEVLEQLSKKGYGLILRKEIKCEDDLDLSTAELETIQRLQIILLLIGDDITISEKAQKKIAGLSSKVEVLLGFGLEAEQIDKLLEATQVKGIALHGGEEIRPGFKDFDELAEILEALETED